MFRPPPLPRTLDAGLRDLDAKKPSVRIEAIRDLARHAESSRATVVAAIERALRDEAKEVRASAATALADIEARESTAALITAAADPDVIVRQMAIAALGEIGDPGATPTLRAAMDDAAPEVRFQAVIAYPRAVATREEAVQVLLAATRDEDPLVIHIALRMAEELTDDGRREADERVLVRGRALLRHESPLIRVASAILLARSAREAARKDRALCEVITAVVLREVKTPDGEDEAAAVELAGELGLVAAKPGLERRAFGGLLLRRDRFAWHARVSLAQLGDERARREIMDELGSWDRDRRTLAIAAAGKARMSEARATIAAMRGDTLRADESAVVEALAALDGTPEPAVTEQKG
jgi:HEAT repeat protein